MNIKNLGLAALVSLGLYSSAKAQFVDIPEFYHKYGVDAGLVRTDEEIFWSSKKFSNGIQQLHGHVDLEASVLFVGADFYLGMITEIDRKNQTITNIIYDDDENDGKNKISNFDKKIIAKYNLNTEKVKNITSELFDYKNRIVKNLETEVQRPLYDNEIGFQEGYFTLAKSMSRDTTMMIHYRGDHHPITTLEVFDPDEKKIVTYIDMTIIDPRNPGSRKNIIDDIDYLKLFINSDGIPEKVMTTINILFGIGVDVYLIK